MNAPHAPADTTHAPLFAAHVPALLALADGTVFRGRSIGATGQSVGEVVFNTAMTGYQEILTDPSYAGQIVTLTYPHIGNIGVNPEDVESRRAFAAGLVIRDLPRAVVELPQHAGPRRVPGRAERGRHRRHRHAQAHAHPAREGRAERLPRRRRGTDRSRRRGRRRRARRRRRRWPGRISRRSCRAATPYEWTEVDLGARRRLPPPGGAALPRRRLRLRRQAQHPAHAGRARLPRHRGAGADAGAAMCWR